MPVPQGGIQRTEGWIAFFENASVEAGDRRLSPHGKKSIWRGYGRWHWMRRGKGAVTERKGNEGRKTQDGENTEEKRREMSEPGFLECWCLQNSTSGRMMAFRVLLSCVVEGDDSGVR